MAHGLAERRELKTNTTAEIFADTTPADPGFWLCFAALPVLTYVKYAPLRFWSFDHSSASSQNCARIRAWRAGD